MARRGPDRQRNPRICRARSPSPPRWRGATTRVDRARRWLVRRGHPRVPLGRDSSGADDGSVSLAGLDVRWIQERHRGRNVGRSRSRPAPARSRRLSRPP
jgi:hypothetical protein